MTAFPARVYNLGVDCSIYCSARESGGVAVAQQVRRIMITLPDSLLQEVDGVAKQENRNRSEFIREAMRRYIEEKRRLELRERLKEGYRKMAGLNLELAGEAVAAENEALALYEEVLARGNGTEGA